MARDDLEPLPLDDDEEPTPGAAGGRPRWPRWSRWPFLVAVALVACLVAGVWVHQALAPSELTFLSLQWDTAQALIDNEGTQSVQTLRASTGTTAYTTALISAVYREQVTELARFHRRLHDRILIDPGLARLRSSMLTALATEQRDLGHDADFWSQFPAGTPNGTEPAYLTSASLSARTRVETQVAAAFGRFHIARPAPGPVPPLHTAQSALDLLRRFADQPTGASLLVATSKGLELVDIDHSRITPLPGLVDPVLEVVQIVDLGATAMVRAAAPDGEAHLVGLHLAARSEVTLGRTTLDQALLAGEGPHRVLARHRDGSVVEFDDQLRQIAGPFSVPDVDHLVGLAPAGLVVATPPAVTAGALVGQGTIEVLDRANPSTVRRVVGDGEAFALCGNDVIWADNVNHTHLTDLGSGLDRTLNPGSSGLVAVGAPWSCSPDGTRVAGAWFGPVIAFTSPSTAPAVIDLASGTVQLTTDGFASQPDASGIAWTPAGDRIFLAGNPGPNSGPDLVTFRPGDRQVTHLRIPGQVLAFCPVPVSPG